MTVIQSTRYEAIIVGAGIVGAACADELSRRGMRVLIIDLEGVATGATGAAMGHIVVMDDSEAQFALTRYSQQLWYEIRDELPDNVDFQPRGTIWIAADEEEMSEVRRKHESSHQRGVPTQILDQHELRRLEPNLRDGLLGGLLVPQDCVLNPARAARFLVERAKQRGTELRAGTAVEAMGEGNVRLADGSTVTAKIIVNAAGPYSPNLTPGLDIKKRKGHLSLTEPRPGFIRHQLVELGYLKSAHKVASDSVAFNVQPRRDGSVIVGSSRQYGAEDSGVDDHILARMLDRAREYMPALDQLSIQRSWTGFRAATSDKLPLIGPWPGDESLFIATGHEGLGITTSLATARILADQIEGTPSEIPVEPYLPARMLARQVHG
jgi:D-hydroxyproline dehydrogenase subunit beta